MHSGSRMQAPAAGRPYRKPAQLASAASMASTLVDQVTQVEGLGEHPGTARRLVAGLERHGGEAGDEHDPEVRAVLGGAARQLDPVEPRHDHVGQQEVDVLLLGQGGQGVDPVADRPHPVPGALQRFGEEAAHAVIVFGKKYERHSAFACGSALERRGLS